LFYLNFGNCFGFRISIFGFYLFPSYDFRPLCLCGDLIFFEAFVFFVTFCKNSVFALKSPV
jgi:hypothetical protein